MHADRAAILSLGSLHVISTTRHVCTWEGMGQPRGGRLQPWCCTGGSHVCCSGASLGAVRPSTMQQRAAYMLGTVSVIASHAQLLVGWFWLCQLGPLPALHAITLCSIGRLKRGGQPCLPCCALPMLLQDHMRRTTGSYKLLFRSMAAVDSSTTQTGCSTCSSNCRSVLLRSQTHVTRLAQLAVSSNRFKHAKTAASVAGYLFCYFEADQLTS
jgi:hypothetical protein